MWWWRRSIDDEERPVPSDVVNDINGVVSISGRLVSGNGDDGDEAMCNNNEEQ